MGFVSDFQNDITIFEEYNGIDRYCNICGYNFKRFMDFGIHPREAQCPVCGSLERHRHLFIHILSIFPFLHDKVILHLNPEPLIKDILLKGNSKYFPLDISENNNLLQEKSFKANNFDFIFCIHVLQNLKNDINVMQEMYRILRPSGVAFISVPLYQEFKEYSNSQQNDIVNLRENKIRQYNIENLIKRLNSSNFNCNNISYPHKFFSTYKRCKLGDTIILAKK